MPFFGPTDSCHILYIQKQFLNDCKSTQNIKVAHSATLLCTDLLQNDTGILMRSLHLPSFIFFFQNDIAHYQKKQMDIIFIYTK